MDLCILIYVDVYIDSVYGYIDSILMHIHLYINVLTDVLA